MSVRIGSNISSLTSQRRVNDATRDLSKISERLSSGLRITRAADDAAGLQIAESLKADQRIYSQAVRNVNDGVSLLNIASGALTQLSNIVMRQRELAEQAANGTYSDKQRQVLNKESQALVAEYNRIVQVTSFNGLGLTDGQINSFQIQAGIGTDESLGVTVGAELGPQAGTGVFTLGTTFSGVGDAGDFSAADLDGDGVSELIASYAGGNVSIYRQDGSGSFTATQSLAVGGPFGPVITQSDLDEDGDVDLILQGQYHSRLNVLLNNGDGSFRLAFSSSLTAWIPLEAQVGDINGDGIKDLVIGDVSGGSNFGFETWLGQSNGGYVAGQTVSVPGANETRDLSLADMNGDGILDVVAAGTVAGSHRVNVYQGDGRGSFSLSVSFAVATTRFEIADINNDGRSDIVSVSGQGAANVATIIQQVDGTLATGQFLASTFGNASVKSADLDNDGDIDFVVESLGGDNGFQIFRNNGSGSYAGESAIAGYGNFVALRDFNGDGKLDIAGRAGSTGGMAIFLQQSSGSFNLAYTNTLAGGSGSNRMAIGDFNGDGVTDIASGAGSSPIVSVLTGVADSIRAVTTISGGDFDISTRGKALSALRTTERQLRRISLEQGAIGAFQSRLATAAQVIQTKSQNYQAAESQIRDADISAESAALVRTQILQQAAVSVLAQANQQPSLALRLLGGG